MKSRNQKVREMRAAHDRLMDDLITAQKQSLGDTAALLRRAINHIKTLNEIVNRQDGEENAR